MPQTKPSTLEQTLARRKVLTAQFMLRVIRVEQEHGIVRPDIKAFKERMETQARDR